MLFVSSKKLHLEKEITMTLKLCQLIEYKLRNTLWKNYAEDMHQKLVPDSL